MLCLPQAGYANAREDGLQAFKQGKYELALRYWIPLAEAGDSEIQYNLGVMYTDGRGVEKDIKQAIYWLTEAAEQEDADAQFRLGKLYTNSKDVEQDLTKAESWIRKSALGNNGNACYYLAQFYAHGKGLPKDNELAYAGIIKAPKITILLPCSTWDTFMNMVKVYPKIYLKLFVGIKKRRKKVPPMHRQTWGDFTFLAWELAKI